MSAGKGSGSARFPAAWLTLDKNDSDLILFTKYLIAALRTIFVGACANTMQLFQGLQPLPLDVISTTLSNDIEQLSENFILVLDECYTIQEQAVPGLFNELVRH
jgi:ATP/maltotriose-dependent transcriptional regulator MalT